MNVLFISLSKAISDINNRGIYPDLLREFLKNGHTVYIVHPYERRYRLRSRLTNNGNIITLGVRTLNITKTNVVEKGLATLFVSFFFKRGIRKFLKDIKFDLILYSTPPITFNNVIKWMNKKNKSLNYLLLKDIFPQNALDLGLITKKNPFYWYFKKCEKELYQMSDIIGCMSPANVSYIKDRYPRLNKKVEVCPNCIDLNTSKAQEIYSSKKDYSIPEDSVVFIYGGNLGVPQGIDFLINILKKIKMRDDIFFIICGSGTEAYKLKNFISEENPSNVILYDFLPIKKYDELLSISDVGLIFLDYRYSIPNYPSRLLDYLKFEKPIIIASDINTDLGHIAEKNMYGYWVESVKGNEDEFISKINVLASNKELRLEMGENGFKYLKNHYTAEISYKIIMKHFENNDV